MSAKELRRQHQGSIATCGTIKEGAHYFRRFITRTSIQINHDLNTASPRDLVRKLKANGFDFKGHPLKKTANGKIPYQWTLLNP